MKLVLTHNEAIKTFDDISSHLELEVECRNTNHNTIALLHKMGARVVALSTIREKLRTKGL